MIKQLLDEFEQNCCDQFVSVIVNFLLSTNKSQYFGQTRPIIVNCCHQQGY